MKVILDHTRTFQRFEGFGASGAWWAQLVGGRSYRDVISRLLFSKRDGIGLRTYRYNIGPAGEISAIRSDGRSLFLTKTENTIFRRTKTP